VEDEVNRLKHDIAGVEQHRDVTRRIAIDAVAELVKVADDLM
jgi:hypothetical protein